MVLKAILDNLDDVPADVAEHYVEKNGKFELGIEGGRTEADVARLNAALVKERNDHKLVKEQVKAFAPLLDTGLEPAVIVERVNRFPELEIAAAGKIDDKRIDEIVQGRIASKIAPLERELKTVKEQNGQFEQTIGTYKTQDRVRTVHSAIREAATKANMLPTAVEDALIMGERVFDIDETGRVVTKDNVGATPGVDPVVWLGEMQAKRAHWWPASQGSQSSGGNGRISGVNPFSGEHWNLTEQGKILTENPKRAEDMARAAGTTVGGRRPAAK